MRYRACEGGFDNFLQFALRRHMPLNSRGLRRYKVYKDLRPPRTYVEVRIHIHVTRGGYTWRDGAAIKARRDRESFIVAGLHFIPRVCGRKSNKTPLGDDVRLVTNRKWYKTMDIYLCSKTMEWCEREYKQMRLRCNTCNRFTMLRVLHSSNTTCNIS